MPYLQEIPHIWNEFTPFFDNSQDFKQLLEFDQLVESAYSGKSNDIVGVAHTKYEVKRQNSQRINSEPAFNILTGDLFPVNHKYEVLVIKGCEKRKYDV